MMKKYVRYAMLGLAIFALALLGGGLLLTAQLLVTAAGAGDRSKDTSVATALASQKLEQLRSLAWGITTDGADLSDLQSDVARWPVGSGGTGLAPSPPGTLQNDTAGYVDYLDAGGRWLAAG